eukprot:TRINITY_DN1268_c4_g2_i1.p1 TRINITY_DN1268_c4_g2~~TRINITY_DN1268_c4_g2_i1.p1  ORF type:complete len:240 (+),score=37.11 TRINITY_DN1268_c4_g2_i1:73-720(+)
MSSHSISLSPASFGKMYLHCFKYASRAVSGLLVGKSVGGVVYVADVLPLFHTYTQLCPMVEVGIAHAQEWAKDNGMRVVGYYAASAGLDDRPAPTKFTENVMKSISSEGESIVIQVLNDKIRADISEIPYKFFSASDLKTGRTAESGICKIQYLADGALCNLGDSMAPFERLRLAVKEDQTKLLVDFEEHLEDVNLDFTGSALTKFLTENVAPLE